MDFPGTKVGVEVGVVAAAANVVIAGIGESRTRFGLGIGFGANGSAEVDARVVILGGRAPIGFVGTTAAGLVCGRLDT